MEFVTILSGFIIPRMIIGTFGSDVNGLTGSITSFIGYITLLQSGVGSVAKAAMYKPLAENDGYKLNVIVNTVERFFRKIAYITVIYIGFLMVVFPVVISKQYDFWYSASLVGILGVNIAAQYFFGITYQMLLEADQKSYVYSIIQIFTVIINTILTVLFIKAGFSIQIVKLGSAFIFVLRPLILSLYAKRKYKITNSRDYDDSLIKQRWDGFIQAIAYFIHSKTDVFVLTILSTFVNVSIYSVYALVTTGLASIIKTIDKAVGAAIGNIIACNEKDNLMKTFTSYNMIVHIISTAIFSTASITIFKFVEIYIGSRSNDNYIQYAFGFIILAAEYLYCLRLPYNSVIYAAGKFKETRASAALEAAINIVISVILVHRFGLIGVAIGTLVAMIYRTISFVLYLRKEILNFSAILQVKRYAISLIAYSISIILLRHVDIVTSNYFSWSAYALLILISCSVITVVFNYLFLCSDFKLTLSKILSRK